MKEETKHSHQYLSSVMSLVCRWPPFDYTSHSKYYYQKIKSDQIMKVAHIDKKKQVGSDIFIVPTDDERLKIVIIPMDVLHSKPESSDAMTLAF
jgi:hypothetical protein